MKCLYCDSEITKINFKTLFIQDDLLCTDCRKKLKINHKYIQLTGLKVETIYNYDEGIFKDLLIQYKECYDEALSNVFLYLLEDYIRIKYHGYKILLVPSCNEKISIRGFNHLRLIYKNCKLPIIDGLKMKNEFTQEGKDFSNRMAMMDNYVYDGDKLDKVLIVDDVVTSGSSIIGCYRAVRPKARKIKAFSLSRKENAFIYINKCDKI